MNIIKLTSAFIKTPVYVNVQMIGHFYRSDATRDKKEHTKLGVTTHNNGGFEVVETVEEILKLINYGN